MTVPAAPLRVAIIGSGPSGFYAAEHLQKKLPDVEIDMFDRLPTPYGLVRGGVAPDHPKIKSVTRIYDRIAAHPGFRFLGNVNIGSGIEHDELMAHYDAVIYATGAETDRQLGIPGEALAGSHAATEFVGWYNGHPDYRDRRFDLSATSAVVVGMGNVAMDVARILASSMGELTPTDISQHALDALRAGKVDTIYVLGRRGPAQAAFTNPELKELGELAETDVIVDPREIELDEHSALQLSGGEDRTAEKNLHTLQEFAARKPEGRKRKLVLRFLVSPVEILGGTCVEGVKLVKNRLVRGSGNDLKAEATGETETLPAGLVFRSVGYKGVAVPGVPFDPRAGVIPNVEGRVLAAPGAPEVLRGVYAVGWIKRGPSGVIGTNKPDSVETADRLLEDLASGAITPSPRGKRAEVDQVLRARGVQVVSYADWQKLDALEQAAGKPRGAPREKFTRVPEMLAAIQQREQ
ncbi:MAG: Ferredoxin--NADP(+) reductase [Gemmatimonadetes bacterium]|nr:Ferredoxin--NADP(+) reductase [Gemmatimonadota bacterium]